MGKLKSGLLTVVVLAACGYGAFFYLNRPSLPKDLDISPESREEAERTVRKAPVFGPSLFATHALVTPAALRNPEYPKFYVFSNLPEGSKILIVLVGIRGGLIGAQQPPVSLLVTLNSQHYAAIEHVTDNHGQPLPKGVYYAKVVGGGLFRQIIFHYMLDDEGFEDRLREYEKQAKDKKDKKKKVKAHSPSRT